MRCIGVKVNPICSNNSILNPGNPVDLEMHEPEIEEMTMKRILFVFVAAALVVFSTAPTFASAASMPGSGGTSDPIVVEGVPTPLGFTVYGGYVVVCDQVGPCSLTDETTWSDLIVFYNFTDGPFVENAAGGGANYVEVFSTGVSGAGSLANFLASYQGSLPIAGLDSIVREGSDGTINYYGYTISSPEAVSEPGTLSLLLVAVGLAGLGIGGKRLFGMPSEFSSN